MTAYFPSTLKFKLGGVSPSRQWSTDVSYSPTGQRVNARQLWLYPKRRRRLTVLGYDDATFATLRDFLYTTAKGRMGKFYIFDPKVGNFMGVPTPPLVLGGGGGLPVVLPFLGGSLTAITQLTPVGGVVSSWVYPAISPYTFDNAGPGGEIRITANGGTAFVAGNLLTMDINNTKPRILVSSQSDVDDFNFDWSGAIPPTETNLDLLEEWS